MPIATIELLEGYDAQVKARLGQAVTDALRGVIDAPADVFTVIIRDIPTENYLRGGTRRTPGPALPDPAQTVREFLGAMEARDLPRAESMLGTGFAMTFPGGIRMSSLPDLIEWARPRYRFVRKTYERFDALGPLVYCFGTLSGEWPDGTAFEGIRFIDRFELAGGKIIRQDVWNDMGEARLAQEAGA